MSTDPKENNNKQKSYALYLQAMWYQLGVIETKYNKAIELYEKAIELGNSSAMFNRAEMHEQGLGGEINYDKAIELYERAIELGDSDAMYYRAFLHEQGLGGTNEKNYAEAIRLYRQAGVLGHSVAKLNFQSLVQIELISSISSTLSAFLQGMLPSSDFEKALRLVKQLDDTKDAYRTALLNEWEKPVSAITKQFTQDCEKAIAQAKLEFKVDLNWSSELTNLLKALANPGTQFVTLEQDPSSEKSQKGGSTLTKIEHHGHKKKETLEGQEQQEQQRTINKLEDSENRQKIIERATGKLEDILTNLSQKIGTIEQKHRFTKAYDKSVNLLKELQLAKDQYLGALKDETRSVLYINQSFESHCKTLIDEAKPLLAKDLGWGDYLTNLFKSIANAILWAVTFGKSNTFFPLTKSESLSVVEEAQSKLKPD